MTPPPSEPTLGEVVRRLDEVSRHLDSIVARLERRDTYIEENFVRQRVWIEARKGDQAIVANLAQDIGAIQQDRKTDQGWRRQMWLAIGTLAVTSLIAIVGLIINFTSAR